MSADRHQVNVVLVDVDRDLANCLSSVCVEEDLALSAQLAYLLCRLDDTCSRAMIVKARGKMSMQSVLYWQGGEGTNDGEKEARCTDLICM